MKANTPSASNNRNHKARCPVCSGISQVAHRVRGYTICKCSKCAHCFLDPLPSLEELKSGYAAENTAYVANDTSTFEHLEKSDTLGRRGAKFVQSYLGSADYGRGRRFLDIGAGSGKLLRWARERGWDSIGLEPGPWGAEAAAKYNLRIEPLMVEDAIANGTLQQGAFDLVAMIDVLEHLRDPRAVLRSVSGILKRNGVFICQFPASDSIAHWTRRSRWPLILLPGHIHYFSRTSLRVLAAECGLEVIAESSRVYTPVLPKAHIMPIRLLEPLFRVAANKAGLGDLRIAACRKQ